IGDFHRQAEDACARVFLQNKVELQRLRHAGFGVEGDEAVASDLKVRLAAAALHGVEVVVFRDLYQVSIFLAERVGSALLCEVDIGLGLPAAWSAARQTAAW